MVGGMRIDDLQWTEIAIGERAAVDCPCPQVTISRQAYRVCGGDFITGGRWNESEVTECEFDVLALELCSAVVCTLQLIEMQAKSAAFTIDQLHIRTRDAL